MPRLLQPIRKQTKALVIWHLSLANHLFITLLFTFKFIKMFVIDQFCLHFLGRPSSFVSQAHLQVYPFFPFHFCVIRHFILFVVQGDLC